MSKNKTLYQLWIDNNLPVNLHEATKAIFHAYKIGVSGHRTPLMKAFPEYFVDPWDGFYWHGCSVNSFSSG